jgi:hypothetical protein
MKDFKTILKRKIDYYGHTEAAYEFAAEEYVESLKHDYKLQILEEVRFGFSLCSDHSTICLGYRNLLEEIRREKENKPIDKTISPVKPYEPGKRREVE